MIANAVKKTFSDIGTLEPNKDNTPNEKAISVAEGIAQPFKVSVFSKFTKIYISAGTSIPPTAAIIGSIACLIFESSPWINSLLISSVTKKKKTAIRTSFIQCKIDNFKPKLLNPRKIYFSRVSKYKYDIEELLIIRANIALINNNNPLEASSLKNHLKGDDKYLSMFYFAKSSMKSFISSSDWYKLFNKILIFGNITIRLSLKVSKTRIKATIDIIITKNNLI